MVVGELKKRKSSDIKCTSCGGPMEYSPLSGKLECLHCKNQVDFVSPVPVIKKPFEKVEEEFSSWNKESVITRCTNCGAKEVVSEKNMSHTCPFCGSSKVVDTKEHSGLKPNGVLAFTITKQEAQVSFLKWLKKKKFTPNDLKKTAKINEFMGVYTPTWSYDTLVHTKYKGVLERSETVQRGDSLHTETVSINVSGNREDSFKDLLVPVGQKIDRVSFNNLEPFNFSNLKVYDNRFLAGFMANHYTINANEAWGSATQIIKSTITDKIVKKHNADRVRSLDMNITHSDTKYSYLLLPIWVCNYFYNNKLFNFFVNGSTGKVSGKVPRSLLKILAFIFMILSLFVILAYSGFIR